MTVKALAITMGVGAENLASKVTDKFVTKMDMM